MTTLDDGFVRPLSIGVVAQRTFAIIGRHPALVFGLAFVLGGIPSAAHLYLTEAALSHGLGALSGGWALRSLVSMLISAFLEACLITVGFADMAGRSVSLERVISTSGTFFLPLFAVNLLSTLGIIVGCILLVVPGLILAVMWLVAGPALLAERSGITAVFGSSVQLTRGNRWTIFGLMLLYALAFMILESITTPVHMFWMGGPFDFVFSPIRALGGAIISTLAIGVGGIGLAVLYAELRGLKGDWTPAQLAD